MPTNLPNYRKLLLLQKQDKQLTNLKTDIRLQERENAEIRDRMAIERTKFANERTFLAYIRTSLALVIAGLTFLEFFDNTIYKWIGGLFIPADIIAGLFGLRRFIIKQDRIRHSKNDYVPTSPIHAHVAEKVKEQAKPNSLTNE